MRGSPSLVVVTPPWSCHSPCPTPVCARWLPLYFSAWVMQAAPSNRADPEILAGSVLLAPHLPNSNLQTSRPTNQHLCYGKLHRRHPSAHNAAINLRPRGLSHLCALPSTPSGPRPEPSRANKPHTKTGTRTRAAFRPSTTPPHPSRAASYIPSPTLLVPPYATSTLPKPSQPDPRPRHKR